MILLIILSLVIYGIYGSIWGWAVNKIVENKGYSENWFWWGFFFGFIALLVALTKPDLPRTTSAVKTYSDRSENVLGENYVFRGFGHKNEVRAVPPSDWTCPHCHTVNAGYVGTCGCGYDKSENMPGRSAETEKQDVQNTQSQQPQMFYCTSCGKQMEADSNFCRYCGAKAGA